MRFSKDQMFNELRTIFLFEADHIAMGAGFEMASRFIGFETEKGEYLHEDPAKVDLTRFQIAQTFSRGYEFAFRPSVLNWMGTDEVQDLLVFMHGTPRAGGIASGGETHKFMTSEGYCQTVADCTFARWKLESEEHGTFSTRELALLANMTEGAVRNAMADKTDSGLRPVAGSKNPILVEYDEALRWLQGRRGFLPFPQEPREDQFLAERLRNLESAKALGDLIKQCLMLKSGQSDTAHQLDSTIVDEWKQGIYAFDQEVAVRVATLLGLDVPLFVGKSLELALRRDAT